LQLSFPRLLAPLRISGIVRWVRTLDDNEAGIGVGIEFTDFTEAARAELGQIVEQIRTNNPEYVQQGIKVLLVEDNPHVAAMIRDGLASGRYSEVDVECVGASDGREALQLLFSQSFDVLVIDVNLPVVDGPAVITALREDAAHRSMPVIAVSAGGEVARQEAMAAGADFFLDKPMRLREIFATMHLLLDGQHAQ
jgi:CheY-like chemotaxis protein